ncbi:MAG TPA: carboxypeptidase regulatory-like domain-containing protein [Pyrinomonadaceae bacterium]|nr:carboxypeptidase regulatory-like domain-containing protein [Pyrinomonadaceae bacterium]
MFLSRKFISAVCALVLVALPLAGVRAAAGGTLTGKITDPRGAAVVDATVTVADPVSEQTQTATTDAEGRFKVEGLTAGVYVVTVTARGFGDVRREGVKVEEGKAAVVDVKLEVESIDAGSVNVTASGLKANADPVYMKLRQQAADFTNATVLSVNNLNLKRDAATFTLRSGEIYFLPPVEGRTVSAVFIGEGEINLVPPTETEKKAIAIFTEQPNLSEQFTYLVLRFTDQTFDELQKSPNASKMSGTQMERARELYRANQALLRKQLRFNIEIRTLADIYAPNRPGYFTAFIGGKRYNKLVYQIDPLGLPDFTPEEVALISYGESNFGAWTAFHLAEEYVNGTAKSSEDNRIYDITRHEIDGAIRGTSIAATDRVTLRTLVPGTRVLPFSLYRTLRVSRVQDESGADLNFIQEDKSEDADFAVIMPQTLDTAKPVKLTIQYQGGGAIADAGGGNFFLIPRATWYPNNGSMEFGDRATFDMTFRFPKGFTFIGTGAPLGADLRDGDVAVSKWSSGETELAVAGFNYGDFKKKVLLDKDTGYGLEFYANSEVPDDIKAMQMAAQQAEANSQESFTTIGGMSTAKMADASLSEAQNSTRLFNAFFGKLPYTRFAMSQQPAANFGQAWPTLIFMPFTAFMDATQRSQLMGTKGGTSNFWRYVGPHELAHQWWGHIVGWDSYHDQWMSEGFAEFSASLYVQYVRKDTAKFVDFWESQRRMITQATPATKGIRPYTVGPVTQGYRLNNAKTGGVARYMIYPKGAYILHMLRMMMYDQVKTGDQRFQTMMKDFIKTNYNQNISTEDLKAIVEKHMTPEMDLAGNRTMDWFFNQWVYGTEMPSYRLEYQINGNTLTGKVTQSGVSPNFGMLLPLYVDFGKGFIAVGKAKMIGNQTIDVNIPFPDAPKRAALCALNDVLALEIANIKR